MFHYLSSFAMNSFVKSSWVRMTCSCTSMFHTYASHCIHLLGSSPVVTPILGCNMAILVAIWINCIYVWSLTGGCIWNGAIAFCILLMWCCNMMVLQCTKKTNATTIWLQARILLPVEWLRELLLRRNMWLPYDTIATNELVAK